MKIKKKAIVTTQSDNDASSSNQEDQNIENLCLMAQDGEIISEHILDFIFDELQDTFYELLDEI